MKERLHKILARSTELSLRAAEKAIMSGEVSVNGKFLKELGLQADPSLDDIRWKGKPVKASSEKIYLIYHKPKSKLVTKKDTLDRPTIWSDLKNMKGKINAVGRLDYDSEGLMILTNDGELQNRLTHPSYHVKKSYNVKVKGYPTGEEIDQIRDGVKYRGVRYKGATVKMKSETKKHRWLDVTISEGKNRQVRHMFAAIGHPVLKLKRIAIGPVHLGKLEPGKWRPMRPKDLILLKREVGLR